MVQLILFLGIILLFFFLPVSFRIYYHKLGKDDLLILEMTFLRGLLKRRKVISLIKTMPYYIHKHQKTWGRWFFFKNAKTLELDSPYQLNLQGPGEFWERYRNYGLGVTLLTYFLPAPYQHWVLIARDLENKGRFDRFIWITRFGAGDPAYTSLIYGLLWTLKAGLLKILQSRYKFYREPKLQVISDYRQTKWDTLFDCIFRVKLGYIIIVALIARLRARASF